MRVLFATAAVALLIAGLDANAGETKTAIFAGGCFWCVEDAFDAVPGVVETISGYAGGTRPDPTYESHQGYVEAVRVRYDPTKVSYQQLLDVYWRNIDPFDDRGQFCDKGSSYRAMIFTEGEEEQRLAEASKRAVEAKLKQPVVTEIKPAASFYAAEDYHQDYHLKNPARYKFYKWNCGRAQRLEQIWGS